MSAHERICALTALLLAFGPAVPAAAGPADGGFDTHHQFIVVTFSNDPYRPAAPAGTTGRRYTGDGYRISKSARDEARRIAARYTLREAASWPIKELGVHCVVFQIPDGRSVMQTLAELQREPRIALAQSLQQFHTLTSAPAAASYNDPLYGLQSNLALLGVPAAHQRSQGAGVRVGLIDTGVDSRHPDLRDRISSSRSFIPDTATRGETSSGGYRHGTAMAGLIAAVANNNIGIVGIAPRARVEVFEACWQLKPDADEAVCNTFTLAKAIAAALEARVPLINLSIAGPADALLGALVRAGLKRGVIFVGSVAQASDSFPTDIEGVISVGSSEHGDGGALLNAPATHVLTLLPGGQYDFESGTSVAAAEVTGVVALLLGVDSSLTSAGIVALLRHSSSAGKAAASPIDVAMALGSLPAGRDRAAGR